MFTKRFLWLALPAVLGFAACGGDGDDGLIAQYVGTWKYTSGTSTTKCGAQSETDQLTGTVSISKGIALPLVLVDGACTLNLEVTGKTATARAGQQCSETDQGVNITLKFDAYTFTVNGAVADESGSATLMASGPGGTVNCTTTQSAKLMKISM